jgi:hypothetical protein
VPRECISGARGAHIQDNDETPLGTLGAAAKLALLIVLQGVAVCRRQYQGPSCRRRASRSADFMARIPCSNSHSNPPAVKAG